MVICKECNKELKRISNTHLLFNCKNKLTMQEYAIKHNIDLIELIEKNVIDNTINTRKEFSSEKKQNIKNKRKDTVIEKQIKYEQLNEEEKQIIIGSLLGDGYIWRGKELLNSSYLILEQGARQIDYLLWKGQKLKKIGCKFYQYYKYSTVVSRYTSRNQIRSTCSYMIGNLCKEFYNENGKIIKEEIINQLTPLGLAIWYMDDGTYCKRNTICELCTQSFSYEDNKKIVKMLKEKFDIQTEIYKGHKENQYVIRFFGENRKKFFNLIRPHIFYKMRYKIGEEGLPLCKVGRHFHFNSAHYLSDYNGKCNQEHGGRWDLWIYVKDVISPETGMVVDYGYLKTIVDTYLIKNLDHLHLNKVAPELRWRSTTEILSMYFWKILIEFLPNLYEIELYETPDSKCVFQGPSLDDMKLNKDNDMVKLLNSFAMKDIVKNDRIKINFRDILSNEHRDGEICAMYEGETR